MKKYIMTGFLILLLFVLIGCSSKVEDKSMTPVSEKEETYSLEDIKKIAFDDANVVESDIQSFKYELEQEGLKGKFYDISFIYKNDEYEYKINATTGAIKEYDKKTIKKEPINTDIVIGQDKAKSIALSDALLEEAQVGLISIEEEFEAGKFTAYSIEFEFEGVYYDYEIDGYNGNVLEKSKDTY